MKFCVPTVQTDCSRMERKSDGAPIASSAVSDESPPQQQATSNQSQSASSDSWVIAVATAQADGGGTRGQSSTFVGIHTPWPSVATTEDTTAASTPDSSQTAFYASNFVDPLFARCSQLSMWASPIPTMRVVHDPVHRRRLLSCNAAGYELFGTCEQAAVKVVRLRKSLIWLHPDAAQARWIDHLRAIADKKQAHRCVLT